MNVLFVDYHNTTKSQIAEALFRHYANPRHQARSAGISDCVVEGGNIHAIVHRVMGDVDFTMQGHVTKPLTQQRVEGIDVAVLLMDACKLKTPSEMQRYNLLRNVRITHYVLPCDTLTPLQDAFYLRDDINHYVRLMMDFCRLGRNA